MSFLTTPKPPPDLSIPASPNTVKVSCIDTTSRFRLPIPNFLQPEYTGHPNLNGPSFSFLIQHPQQKPILFDLGIRKDFSALKSYPKFVENKWYVHVDKNVTEILSENGMDVDGGEIKSVLWSHHHWDHVGDMSTFPSSTELVVGPGFLAAHHPDNNKETTLLPSDFAGRSVREVNIESEGSGLKIGRFHAYDYFSDGSFYLLSTPGHSIGHMCGLARVSTSPDSFIFMGGDASHHGGEFRPTEYLPIPSSLPASLFQKSLSKRSGTCPGHLLQDIHPHGKADKPFYHVTASFAHNKEVADWTIDGLGEFDAQGNVLMLMAHDDAVVDPAKFAFYPETLNDWYEKGVGEKVRWMFLGDFEEAVESKESGGEAFKWGKYP